MRVPRSYTVYAESFLLQGLLEAQLEWQLAKSAKSYVSGMHGFCVRYCL